ncbi:drug/metabolite transporter (DMT)-like permease [Tenacibaculum adriaticum]|uniref:Drug/metabolite transporter (DMT)-like permease n=1 Tax=Tenacibaculum adriaticum TaxID=413713 RepID=A0A5S5DVI6_9FLAO|nr:EamA family transporter [Tenacibaculum adriaticum]TYP99943.1 drug/metabolite transporter (DMT)-like permease [Tenacibaculum adriaticum]
MNNQRQKWIYLSVLALVWGSSFILMKKALVGLTPIQVGALRILITSVLLGLIGFKSLKKIKKHHWKYVFASALLGTLFPSFLFAFAIQGIDSSIASILNSLTPFNTFLFGSLAFGFAFRKKQFIGILVGLLGTVILILKGADLNPNQNYWYALLPIISSVGYAFNVNIIKKYLQDLEPLAITTGNFVLIFFPALSVLVYTRFFSEFELTSETKPALLYISILAIFGTAIAKVMFNKLIHISSPVFSSSVTYLIPIVAVVWGFFDGEKLSLIQLLAGAIILLGVYLVNKAK